MQASRYLSDEWNNRCLFKGSMEVKLICLDTFIPSTTYARDVAVRCHKLRRLFPTSAAQDSIPVIDHVTIIFAKFTT